MVVKEFGKDFNSNNDGLTLAVEDVLEDPDNNYGRGYKYSSRQHSSGWVISGQPIEGDCYSWVNEFSASHERYGNVWGDFESKVYADSERGYQDFYANHPPHERCYDSL